MTSPWRIIAIALLTGLAVPGRSDAGLIFYTETFQATGTFNGQSFTDATVVLTGSADTDKVVEGRGNFTVILNNSAVAVAGIGSDSITDHLFVSAINTTQIYAQFFNTNRSTVIGTLGSVFAQYDLKGPIGPVAGGLISNGAGPFAAATLTGFFEVSSYTSSTTSFQATLASVPEPSSMAMSALGGLAALGWTRRR